MDKLQETLTMNVSSWEEANTFVKRVFDIYVPKFDIVLTSSDGYCTNIFYRYNFILMFEYLDNFKQYWIFKNNYLWFNDINITVKLLRIIFDTYFKQEKLTIIELDWLHTIPDLILRNFLLTEYKSCEEYIKYLLESKEKFISVLYLNSIERK